MFGLYPAAGDIDVMIASELLEAGRAIQNGFVSPDRTTLIASTHRVYTIGERSDMADGRLDEERLRKTATELAQHAVLDDMRRIAEEVAKLEPEVDSVLLSQFSMAAALSHVSSVANVPILSSPHCSALAFKKLLSSSVTV